LAERRSLFRCEAGLIALTKTLGRELAPENITVNAVAPG
jgi:NAD(P)-dependent dehydrogenase (short-subunit alcohol dehydrogenase family)